MRSITTPVVAARGLTAGYGKTTVVRDVNLEVAPGEIVALLGPNGAGKSTTVMTLAGAIPSLGGEVLLGGSPTTASLDRRTNAGLGLVTEQRAVLMRLSVAENLRVAGVTAEAGLEIFPELEQHLKRRVGDLSGGQQQMLALARVIARNPKALLADELSLGLAPMVVDRLLEQLVKAAGRGVGVLLVEQHVRKALAVADRVVVMRRGRVEISGTPAEIHDQMDLLQSSYL